MTFSAFENAIERSAVGGNFVTCFAALSGRSLLECPGIFWMMMCV